MGGTLFLVPFPRVEGFRDLNVTQRPAFPLPPPPEKPGQRRCGVGGALHTSGRYSVWGHCTHLEDAACGGTAHNWKMQCGRDTAHTWKIQCVGTLHASGRCSVGGTARIWKIQCGGTARSWMMQCREHFTQLAGQVYKEN